MLTHGINKSLTVTHRLGQVAVVNRLRHLLDLSGDEDRFQMFFAVRRELTGLAEALPATLGMTRERKHSFMNVRVFPEVLVESEGFVANFALVFPGLV
jgi:ATP phosphoribosyltransferase regulatory subunit HisZ